MRRWDCVRGIAIDFAAITTRLERKSGKNFEKIFHRAQVGAGIPAYESHAARIASCESALSICLRGERTDENRSSSPGPPTAPKIGELPLLGTSSSSAARSRRPSNAELSASIAELGLRRGEA